ncbi:MAG: ATP-binding protein [Campylobacterota bacterium]|nr:ATP-binding protein [Campylobacterota bacterium]
MSKNKYIILLVVLFVVFNSIIYQYTEQNKNQRVNLSLQTHLDKLQTHYDILMHQEKLTADTAYISTIKKEQVAEIVTLAYKTKDMKKRDILRDKLYSLLKPRYDRLKKKGVLQYHFVFPNNEVFLRFHKPSKYGDDLTNIRKDFAYVNKTLKSVSGFAQGRTAHAFRNVYPLINKQKEHIGAVEISFSSEALQDNLTLISKIHTHFLVNKNIFNTKAWERDDLVLKYNQSAEHPNYMITMTGQHTVEQCITKKKKNLEPILETIDKNIQKGIKFGIYTQTKDKKIISSAFLPIKGNVENEILAWIVAYENNEFIEISIKNASYIRIVLFIISLMLFYFIYRTINQKETLAKQVDIKTMELKDLNENLEQKIIIEVEKNKQIQNQLNKSEKMVAIGEMIGNIAHQWRQPLSVISTASTGMLMQKEFGALSDEDFKKNCNSINEQAQYLSQTIDDFRDFIKGNRKKQIFNLSNNIKSFLSLVEGSIKRHGIDMVYDLQDDINIDGYGNELAQCFLNIFNNANDALKSVLESDRYIFISTKIIDDNIVIKFKDSAGGIPEDIIDKIFEPYFTTKHQAQGTGLGLHMTYNLIVDGMDGTITVKNIHYQYKEKEYAGAEFTILLPIIESIK